MQGEAEVARGLYTNAPLRAATALLLVVPAALAASVDVRWGVFGVVAVLVAVASARAITVLLAATLTMAAADLVLTVDVGNFTFRAAQLAGVALAVAAIQRAGVREYLRFVVSRPGWWAWPVFLVLAVISLLSGAPNRGKGVGYLAWAVFDVVVLAPAVAFHARRHLPRTIVYFVLGSSLVALFGLSQLVLTMVGAEPYLVTQWVGPRPRLNAFSYEPSYFAFQMMIPLALVVGLTVAGRLRAWAPGLTACWLMLASGLVLSTSRSAWGGLVLLTGAFGLAMVLRWRTRALPSMATARVIAAGVVAALLVAAFIPQGMLSGDRLLAERAFDVKEAASARPRMEGLLHAWRLFKTEPVLGVGPGQFGGALLEHPELWAREIPDELRNPNDLVTFNLYLELLAESGALGTALVLAGVAMVLWSLWRRRRNGGLGRYAEPMMWPLVMIFAVMFHFNQTLWRTEVWCLLGLCWAVWPARFDRRP